MTSTTLPIRKTLIRNAAKEQERGERILRDLENGVFDGIELRSIKFGKEMREKLFMFEEGWRNLNHGSFGTYPLPIHLYQQHLQTLSELSPDKFVRYTSPALLERARSSLSPILNAPAPTLVFVGNATTGVNTVLRSLVFEKGDRILYFSSAYGAIEKTILYIAETTPATPVCIPLHFPVEDRDLVSAFRSKIKEIKREGGKVKVAVFDSVISVPGWVVPWKELVKICKEEGVLSMMDAAHGVGNIEVDLGGNGDEGPDFWVSNCHKWLYTPRGCAVLHVPIRNQALIRSTLPTSHGFVPVPSPHSPAPRQNPVLPTASSAFVHNFDWTGTIDPSAFLCVPAAVAFRKAIGGEQKIRDYCHTLAQRAAEITAKKFGTEFLENKTKTSSQCTMSNVRLPLDFVALKKYGREYGVKEDDVVMNVRNFICGVLVDEFGCYAQVMPLQGNLWVRWSAQIYLEESDFEWAGDVVKGVCERAMKGEWVTGRKGLSRL